MKKIILVALLAIIACANTAAAKSPEAYIAEFEQKIGIERISNAHGSLLSMETTTGGNTVLMKIISQGQNYRVDMAVGGQDALIVGNQSTAHVTVGGQTTLITDRQQIDQLVPMREISRRTFFQYAPGAVFTYMGQELFDRKICEVVACKDSDGLSKLYFDTHTGLLLCVNTMVRLPDAILTVEVRFDNYMTFADGKITLPTIMTTTIAGQTTTNKILDYRQNYPTNPAMFKIPQ